MESGSKFRRSSQTHLKKDLSGLRGPSQYDALIYLKFDGWEAEIEFGSKWPQACGAFQVFTDTLKAFSLCNHPPFPGCAGGGGSNESFLCRQPDGRRRGLPFAFQPVSVGAQ
jgi:hypothetical protein